MILSFFLFALVNVQRAEIIILACTLYKTCSFFDTTLEHSHKGAVICLSEISHYHPCSDLYCFGLIRYDKEANPS